MTENSLKRLNKKIGQTDQPAPIEIQKESCK